MPADFHEIRDNRFARLMHGTAGLDLIWTGGRWCEGPAYFPAGKYLIWSDIPNDRLMRWDACSGAVSTFEQPCRNQNGHTVDREGRLVACEHRGRCVSRIEHDGSRTVLADRFEGMRLNSPNDVVVKSDGSIWFTDPTYGIDSEYEGDAAPSEVGASHVYRIDPETGAVTLAIDDLVQPNGIAFSPDESLLYVSDTGRSHRPDHEPEDPRLPDLAGPHGRARRPRLRHLRSRRLRRLPRRHPRPRLELGRRRRPLLRPDGTLIGKILIPEICANVCFGGPKRNRLFICATTSVFAHYVNARGCGF